MKLRRRIIKYFMMLVLFASIINIAISYYLAQTSWERFHGSIRSEFLQKTVKNVIAAYEENSSLNTIDEASIRPRELLVQLPRRFGRDDSRLLPIAVTAENGWDLVVADGAGRFIIGADKAALREETGIKLVSQGRFIGTLWLVPKKNASWELLRNYLFIPLLYRNFLTVLLTSVLALGIAFLLSDYLARHIGEVAQAARNITRGKLEHRVKPGARDELGELAVDFNTMAEKLQEDQRLRRQLQADVVHELRTPLAVCQAVLDSLENGVMAWDAKTLASLQEEIGRMQRLVTDLHELNRADNQQLPLYKEMFTIGDLLERLDESFAELAKQKKVVFSRQIAAGEGTYILYADPDRIMQVFLNLLHNALRHTPEGGLITLRVWVQDDKIVNFAVGDTGEGIPEEILPHIFDRFFSGDKSRSRQRSGTGLGLAIAKEYTQLHGGSISVKSLLQQGTEFIVSLPIEQK